jgi:hypothetical protein
MGYCSGCGSQDSYCANCGELEACTCSHGHYSFRPIHKCRKPAFTILLPGQKANNYCSTCGGAYPDPSFCTSCGADITPSHTCRSSPYGLSFDRPSRHICSVRRW